MGEWTSVVVLAVVEWNGIAVVLMVEEWGRCAVVSWVVQSMVSVLETGGWVGMGRSQDDNEWMNIYEPRSVYFWLWLWRIYPYNQRMKNICIWLVTTY